MGGDKVLFMNWWITSIAGLLSGFAGSLGVGGGGILIVFLTAFLDFSQREAQGINLMFFLPVAIVSTIIYIKQGLVKIKPLLPFVLLGLLGAGVGVFLAEIVNQNILSKIFGAGLIVLGIREFFTKDS